jgi:phage tail-like protein
MSSLDPNEPNDALTAARYLIMIDGHEIGSFPELIGITTEVEPVDCLASADKGVVSEKLPGKTKPATLTLKRGKNSSMELWTWHEAVRSSHAGARKSCSLVIYNTDGKPVARYHLENAWPSKLEIGTLKVNTSMVLTEIVTIVSERIQRVSA